MICGLILAAGVSSRMGTFKPLLPIGDTVFIKRLIGQMREAGSRRVVVVTGYRHEELEETLREETAAGCVVTAFNSRFYDTQMLDSVKLGISRVMELSGEEGEPFDRILLSPSDVVMSPKWIFDSVTEKEADFIRPMYHGEPGHPVLIRDTLFETILRYDGERGLRGAVENSGREILEINAEEPCILLDADTREDYRRAVHEYDLRSGADGRLHPEIEMKLATDQILCGEGFMNLLELVEATGSLQNAARAMKVSYTKVWKMIRYVEKNTSERLIERCAGGEDGGFSCLTDKGRDLLRRWKAMRKEFDAMALSVFQKYFDDFRL